jgi:hypothetical protein
VINEDNYTTYVLTNLTYITATEIVAYGETIYTPEVYEQYGLDLDPERIGAGTDKNYAMLYFSTTAMESEDFATSLITLYFGERQTDVSGVEFYYVYSPEKHVIGKVSAEAFDFLEWPIAKYTNPYLFFEYFTSCDYFEVVSERDHLDHRFTLTGKERTRKATVTTSDGEIIYKETASGNLPLVYETKYAQTASGIEYVGEFENFRDLYYVLITRTLALYAEINESVTTIGDEVVATIEIKTAPKDHPISYHQYDSNGKKGKLLRDEGGNILCHEVLVPTTLSNGSVREIPYEKAFYDEEAKRFFLKSIDSNDANEKPSGFTGTDLDTVKVTTFLPATAYGEYTETIYSYEIYDLYDQYTDYDGNTVSQMNSTYKYIVPTTTKNVYRLVSNGDKELTDTITERAEVGVYIRTATLDKLFSDTHKLLNGEPIDTMGLN